MAKPYKTKNKSIRMRSSNGKFRQATLADVGLSVCPNCNGFMTEKYFGENNAFPDPRLFGYECSKCNLRKDRSGEIMENSHE